MKKLLWIVWCGSVLAAPDIRTIKPDLKVPPLAKGKPAPGQRVKGTHPDWQGKAVYHVLYLPADWQPSKKFPVIVEFAGNGPYRSPFGDVSTGHPEASKMGYGISGGKGYIWLCLPYLNDAGQQNVTQWWGNAPRRNAGPTVAYAKKTVPWICQQFGGDPQRIVLCGFSRGAIACNFIGLHDDEIAKLWRAFIPYSHYDGVHRWGYPSGDRSSALLRLKRLGNRPQFICHENSEGRLNLKATRKYLKNTGVKSKFTFCETGYRNHNDAWLLRPGPVRIALRNWLTEVMAD